MLPIPELLEKAANVIGLANAFCKEQTSSNINALEEALRGVSKEDILAVLNEVGTVYMGLHNMQVRSIGTKPSDDRKSLEVALQIDAGTGPKVVITPLPIDVAKKLYVQMGEELAALQFEKGGLITDPNMANG